MTITITAFERSPDGGKGLARDTRVRWALEEVAFPNLAAYVARGEARAAYKRAFAAQLAVNTGQPGGST
jgi:glutathione S-transferase